MKQVKELQLKIKETQQKKVEIEIFRLASFEEKLI